MIPIYIILGATGSGRREIAFDLIEHCGANQTGKTVVLLAEDEKVSPYDEQVQALPEVTFISWQLNPEGEIITHDLPDDRKTLFFFTNGCLNPVDQIEALIAWTNINDLQVARTLCVINCELCHKEIALNSWYEACIHFSDVVLLNKRKAVTNNWIRDFVQHYEKNHYPCLFELIKKGRVFNPATVLYPESRRLSLIFDDSYSEIEANPPEIKFERDSIYEEDQPVEIDPYLERLPDGRRAIMIPDICDYLE